jgi:arabinose-5-phosphate isomerase
VRQRGCRIVALLGDTASLLAGAADCTVDCSVAAECDNENVVPSASVLAMLATGQALGLAVAASRGFNAESFAANHPGGQLGRRLLLRVEEVMHRPPAVALLKAEASLREVVVAMTERPLGAACIVDDSGMLRGLVTDGDLRRAIGQTESWTVLSAAEMMTASPSSIHPDATLMEALRVMEERARRLSVLPVLDRDGRLLGLLRLHDVLH